MNPCGKKLGCKGREWKTMWLGTLQVVLGALLRGAQVRSLVRI